MAVSRSLPENPSLENLKKQAKGLLKGVRAGEAEARAQVKDFHPRGEAPLAGFTLSEAQLVIARSYGFASWPKLKQYLEVVLPPRVRDVIIPLLGDVKPVARSRDRGSKELAAELLRSSGSIARPAR